MKSTDQIALQVKIWVTIETEYSHCMIYGLDSASTAGQFFVCAPLMSV